MKKNLVALLLVLAVVSVGVFANPNQDTGPKTFTVTTTISGINLMRVSSAQYVANPIAPSSFKELGVVENHGVEAGGDQGTVAYLSTLSNYRKGYKVEMTATAMKSTLEGASAAYINYTITVDGDATHKQITTNNNDTHDNNKVVINTGALSGLNAVSLPITISVNAGQFTNAVEGMYSGEVKFTWIAN